LQFCFSKEGTVLTLYPLRSLAELTMPLTFVDTDPNLVPLHSLAELAIPLIHVDADPNVAYNM
jgi:hypothetical protein